MSNMDKYESFFRYTSGRWLYNEKEQLAIRYVRFNVDALKKVAAEAVGASYCTDIRKTHEGAFNKIFMLRFDNNAELVAKIPTPLVSPPHLCTASEVATMDYVRNVMGLPVPKVFGWCSRAETTDVGAEYILMEKIDGVCLQDCWQAMNADEAKAAINDVVDAQCHFAHTRFSQIGSLFYKDDVDLSLRDRPLYANGTDGNSESPRFCIGPLMRWDLWCHDRHTLNVDHGPWPNLPSFLSALGRKQSEWLRLVAANRSQRCALRRAPRDESPDIHIRWIERFLTVLPHVVPPVELQVPVLWNDLEATSLVVQPKDHHPVKAILDWQYSHLSPLFLQVRLCEAFLFEGDERITLPQEFSMPRKPPNYDSLPDDERAYLDREYELAVRQRVYEGLLRERVPVTYTLLERPHQMQTHLGILELSRTWYNGLHQLRDYLIQLQLWWDDIAPSVPFPNPAGDEEIERHIVECSGFEIYSENVEQLRKELGVDVDGWVSNERFDEVMRRSEELKSAWNTKAMAGPWPFQDGRYSYYLDL
ncbi:unnamed protein product [Somion occarium]|uniref:Aminoglycoside phosphotransferase domain-containing protein n=1 Tax=Somion occarium TaxID=3059160 RepID=A0ABP1CEF2_9APHY